MDTAYARIIHTAVGSWIQHALAGFAQKCTTSTPAVSKQGSRTGLTDLHTENIHDD